MPKHSSSDDEFEDAVEIAAPQRKRRRLQRRQEEEEEEEEEEEVIDQSESRQNSAYTPDDEVIRQNQRGARLDELARSFVRTILGLENKYQVLNRNFITKVMEAEEERGPGVQFKRDLFERIRVYFSETFGMDVVPLRQPVTSSKVHEEYILVNILPHKMKKRIYRFLRRYTKRLNSLDDLLQTKKIHGVRVTRLGDHMVRPASDLVERGVRMLILTIIILHKNNLSQTDLLNALEDSFHLKFTETQNVDILGNVTIGQFLASMVQQQYLRVRTRDDKDNRDERNKAARRIASSKADNSLLIYALGGRALTEFSRESFLEFFKEVYGDWTEALQESAEYTLKELWGSEGVATE